MKIFKHLEEVEEDYFTHMKNALFISGKLQIASFKAFVHSVFPDMYKHDASEICKDIINNVDERTISL